MRFFHKIALAALAAVSAPALADVSAKPDDLQFGHYIEQARKEWGVPGVAVAVISDDRVWFQKGFGVRQQGTQAPVDASTLFAIGSTTKAFTAVALGMLVDEGKLEWDDPVIEHLPWFQLDDPWLTRHVTIRDLLAHRVGVEDSFHIFGTLSAVEVVRRMRFLAPRVRFRQDFLYSNLMYGVAGQVIEAVSGTSWESFVHTRVLEPLGMKSTASSARAFWDERFIPAAYAGTAQVMPVDSGQARVANLAMPHVAAGQGVQMIPWRTYDTAPAAGSLVSNLEDMTRWVRFLLAGGAAGGKPLLSPDTLREILAPQILIETPWIWRTLEQTQAARERLPSGYAMGWNWSHYRGETCLHHGGALYGWYSHVFLIPQRRVGVIVLTNRFDMNPFATAIAWRAFDGLLGLPKENWSAKLQAEADRHAKETANAEAALQSRRIGNTSPPLPLSDYAGVYGNALIEDVRLVVSNGRLELSVGADGFSGILEHWHRDTFRLHWAGRPGDKSFMEFKLDPRGRVSSIDAGVLGELERMKPSNPGRVGHE